MKEQNFEKEVWIPASAKTLNKLFGGKLLADGNYIFKLQQIYLLTCVLVFPLLFCSWIGFSLDHFLLSILLGMACSVLLSPLLQLALFFLPESFVVFREDGFFFYKSGAALEYYPLQGLEEVVCFKNHSLSHSNQRYAASLELHLLGEEGYDEPPLVKGPLQDVLAQQEGEAATIVDGLRKNQGEALNAYLPEFFRQHQIPFNKKTPRYFWTKEDNMATLTFEEQKEAYEVMEKALEEKANDPVTLRTAARWYYRKGENEKALSLVQRYLKLDQGNESMVTLRIRLLLELKRFDETLELVNKAVKRFPGSTELKTFQVKALSATGEQQKSLDALDSLINKLRQQGNGKLDKIKQRSNHENLNKALMSRVVLLGHLGRSAEANSARENISVTDYRGKESDESKKLLEAVTEGKFTRLENEPEDFSKLFSDIKDDLE